jgi:hypothetical protein
MKRIKILLITLLILHYLSYAEKVNIETVKKIAVKVFIENYPGSDKDEIVIDRAIPFTTENDTLFYILNFKQKGFVIISADNAAPPVLGYCYKNKFEQANLPPGLEYLLYRYKGEILSLRTEKVEPTKEIKEKWEQLLDDKVSGVKSAKGSVSPLILSTWGQGWSYNMYCPVDNGTHVPAGCVAVAMAQVLYYWQCRVEGTGQHSYQSDYGTEYADFENANYQWHAMSATSSNQYNALLIYHCGVSVDMDYGPDGSGASTADAEPALQNYFGFQSKANYIDRTWHPFNWKSILKSNLNRGLPIIYRGQDKHLWPTYAHAWVIEGYDTNDKFYCNWGWNGFANGYFSLGDFSPAGYDFNKNEKALVEIEPVRSTGVETPVLSPETFTYNPNGYLITIPEAEGATSYQWTCNHGTIQGSGTTATLYSDCNSTVSVRAYNSQCQIYSGYDSEIMTIEYGPITGTEIVCYSPNETFTLHNYPSGSSVSWTNSSNLTYVSGQGTDNYTVKAHPSASGAGWVEATISGDCADATIRKDIDWVGKPYVNPATIHFTCVEGQGYLCTNASGNEFSFYYTAPYNYFDVKLTNLSETLTLCELTIYGTEGDLDLCFPPPEGTYKFWIRGNNICGTGNWSKTAVDYVVCGFWGLDIFPNPTTGETTVSIVSSNDKTIILNDDEEWHLEVYTQSKLLKLTRRNIKGNKYILNTSGWQTGMYFVVVYYKDEILTETLIVNE